MSTPPMVISNHASSTLAVAVNIGDSTLTVQTGDGALFPQLSLGGQDRTPITVEDALGNKEVMYMAGITGDTLTVSRQEEGTIERNWAVGDRVECRVTAGVYNEIDQGTF